MNKERGRKHLIRLPGGEDDHDDDEMEVPPALPGGSSNLADDGCFLF